MIKEVKKPDTIFQLMASCPKEGREILAKQVENLGGRNVLLGHKAVFFQGPLETHYRSLLELSTASHVFWRVLESRSSWALWQNRLLRHPWEELISGQKTYKIVGFVAQGQRGKRSPTGPQLSQALHLAIQARFVKLQMPAPKLDFQDPKVIFQVHTSGGWIQVYMRSSGQSLHKRGYQQGGHPSPMKETLAAACLAEMGFDGSCSFYDPMCGSGTIAIEAAFIALKKSPLIHRKKGEFGFEHWQNFSSSLWRAIQEESRNHQLSSPPFPLLASDINKEYVSLARRNALKARVEKHISWQSGCFFEEPPPSCPPGLILSNLPYGERLALEDQKSFYQKIGSTLKHRYPGWRVGLMVPVDSPWIWIGLKPKRKRPWLNGAIPTWLLEFSMYEGSKRRAKKISTLPEEDWANKNQEWEDQEPSNKC